MQNGPTVPSDQSVGNPRCQLALDIYCRRIKKYIGAYAAVMGHLFGPNEERGVYRTRDGGSSWEQILFVNENAGAVDLDETFDF